MCIFGMWTGILVTLLSCAHETAKEPQILYRISSVRFLIPKSVLILRGGGNEPLVSQTLSADVETSLLKVVSQTSRLSQIFMKFESSQQKFYEPFQADELPFIEENHHEAYLITRDAVHEFSKFTKTVCRQFNSSGHVDLALLVQNLANLERKRYILASNLCVLLKDTLLLWRNSRDVKVTFDSTFRSQRDEMMEELDIVMSDIHKIIHEIRFRLQLSDPVPDFLSDSEGVPGLDSCDPESTKNITSSTSPHLGVNYSREADKYIVKTRRNAAQKHSAENSSKVVAGSKEGPVISKVSESSQTSVADKEPFDGSFEDIAMKEMEEKLLKKYEHISNLPLDDKRLQEKSLPACDLISMLEIVRRKQNKFAQSGQTAVARRIQEKLDWIDNIVDKEFKDVQGSKMDEGTSDD